MLRIAYLPALALLAAGCASRHAVPAAAATTTLMQTGHATPPASQGVELRHFYLLSPGPTATLVVTRSETAAGPQ